MAADLSIVQKSGAWYSLDGERIGQGRDNARTYLEQHPDLLERIEQKVLEAHGIVRALDPRAVEAAVQAADADEGSKKTNGASRRAAARPS